jgi:23S rRNA pseudouridine1911/1915/1917 synthase
VTAHVRTQDPKPVFSWFNRIDQDTSGVLLFAKNNRLRDLWQDRWNDLVTKRGYYAS